MATTPPTEVPAPSAPSQPDTTGPEVTPPAPDIDQPSPGLPSGDPAPTQPSD